MQRAPWPVMAMIVLALLAAGGTQAADIVTMTGEYYWEEGSNEGVLEKVLFKPTGDGAWDVAFHFRFRGQKHVYRGTAAGSLSEGSLGGEVYNEGKRRKFTFSGEFSDGIFQGAHREVDGSDSWSTGTMTLSR